MAGVSLQRVFVAFLIASLVVPALQAAPQAPGLEPTSMGEALVGFHDGAFPALAAGDRYGGHVVLAAHPDARFAVLRADDLATLRRALFDDGRVAYVEDNPVVLLHETPNDPQYASQYGPALMGFPAAWDATLGVASVTVAVVDSGIRRGHEDFRPELVLQGWDYVSGDAEPNDDCGHGTHVAGTVGAWTNNGKGVAGMAQVKILPMRAFSNSIIDCNASGDAIVRAVRDAADQGAHIISMSFGTSTNSAAIRDAMDYAYAKGVILIASAGNEGGCCVGYPAAYDSVIAVASVTSAKSRSSFSSTGPAVEIAAPGSNIVSTYNDGGYASLSGTSMAAPHVSGAAALALSWAPGTTNTVFRQVLASTAEDLGIPGRDQDFGHGLARIDRVLDVLGPAMAGPDNLPPVASFHWNTNGREVTFDGSASSDPHLDALAYHWSLGDGNTATGAVVTHTYAANGTYDVTLSVDDGRGGMSILPWAIDVADIAFVDPEPALPALKANEWADVPLAGGDTRYFKFLVDRPTDLLAFETTGPRCLIAGFLCPLDIELAARYTERPSDTAADCRADPRGTDARCLRPSPDEGWWIVRVHASDGSGTLRLRAATTGGEATERPGNAPPHLRWGYEPDNLTLAYRSDGTQDPDGDALAMTWDLGDGTVLHGNAPLHTYAAAGTYLVQVTTSDPHGATTILAGDVVVAETGANQPPVAAFAADADELRVRLDGRASVDPESAPLAYAWDLGDGTTLTGAMVTHDYAAAGTYVVTLVVTDPDGADASLTEHIAVALSSDPAPDATPLAVGSSEEITLQAGETRLYKVYLPPGRDWLMFATDGQGCTLLGCPHDVDLAVRRNALPTAAEADCRRDTPDADTSCVFTTPRGGWWVAAVHAASGSGTVTVKVQGA